MSWCSEMLRTNATKPITFILIFLISTDLSILLDVPVFRQVLGFIFLAFVPGAILLCIMRLNGLGLTEKFVLSVGLSISFIMFVGLLIGTLSPLFGYERPLSVISLLISLTVAFLILLAIASVSGKSYVLIRSADLKLDFKDKALFFIPLLFPTLSVLGMHLMNTKDNNTMLIALLLLIPSYVIFISILRNKIPKKTYAPIILLSSISLILLWGMRSNHIIGTDSHVEYTIFMQTLSNAKWQMLQNNSIDTCLSISVLPATYQSFLNINPEYLFKILYPLLFSVAPLVIYIIARNYLDNIFAFLASVFFISQYYFIITTANSRTNIAILFFALSLMVLLHSEISQLCKKILLIVFIISCILSHYSTTYIFFAVFLITWFFTKVMDRLSTYQKKSNTWKFPLTNELDISASSSQSLVLGSGILAIFFMVLFLWYSQITGAAFDNGVQFIFTTIDRLQYLFVLESRDSIIPQAFGSGIGEKNILSKLFFIINWLPIISIFIGVSTTLARYRHRVALLYETNDGPSDILTRRIPITFIILAIACSFVIFAAVALPFISLGYDLDRCYFQMMVVLTLFLVLGGLELARLIRIKHSYLVILIIIIPYFLFSSGTLQNIAGEPASIALNSKGIGYDLFYIYEQEVYACRWLGEKIEVWKSIYVDSGGRRRLTSQGAIPSKYINELVSLLQKNQTLDGYIYLRYFNVVNGNLSISKTSRYQEINEYRYRLSKEEMIYDNGGSEILI